MSSPTNRRRRVQQRGKPLARAESSFFGTIKGIVAPLTSWWSGGDDFEDAKDPIGKRRRTGTSTAPQSSANEDGPTPAKRMRVDSPEPQGYLDPPSAAFGGQHQHQQLATPSRRLPNTLTEINNRALARDAYSPSRISRTMSLDPPQPAFASGTKSLVPDASMSSMPLIEPLDRDSSMEPGTGARFFSSFGGTQHRGSIPPVASRPIFPVMPTQNRDVSMPPSIETLKANPTFVQAPDQKRVSPRKLSSQSSSSMTLGSLMDSRRSTLSPVRTHSASSLLFGAPQAASKPPQDPPLSQYEKVSRQLESYKTELVPTRVRERGAANTFRDSASDPFNKKRKKLILMMDDNTRLEEHANRLGVPDKQKKKATAEPRSAKPYEGKEKRKVRRVKPTTDRSTSSEKKPFASTPLSRDASMSSVVDTQEIPVPPPQKEVFSPKPMSSGPSAGSSLRIGRTLNYRNHAARPSRPASSSRFSAADDDDDAEDERKKEFEMLEAASKQAPVFNIPAGFSFAKDTQPMKFDAMTAKEPPVSSLPFSFGKTATSAPAFTLQAPVPTFELPAITQPPVESHRKTAEPAASAPPPASSGVPNFFAGSKYLEEQPKLAPEPLPVSLFSKPTVPAAIAAPETQQTSPVNAFAPLAIPPASSGPSEASEQPRREEQVQPEALKPSVSPFSFGAPPVSQSEATPVPAPSTPFSFGNPAQPSSAPSESTPKPPSFSFGAGAPAPPTNSLLFGNSTATEAPKPVSSAPFSFGQPAAAKEKEPEKPAPFSFGNTELKKPETQPPSQTLEAPKPLFGSGGFSFGQGTGGTPNENKPSSSGFSSSGSGTASSDQPKAPTFTFGVTPSTPAAPSVSAPTPFSFGSPSSNVNQGIETTDKPFSFGGFGSTSTTRPVTPPRNDDQDSRMEESPTREVKPSNQSNEPRPTLGFSFGTSSASNPFAPATGPATPTAAPAASPFTFGSTTPSASPNPFGQSSLPQQESKPSFSFGQAPTPTQSTSGFSFGAPKPPSQETQRPSTSGSFSFGSPSTAPSNPFSFGSNPSTSTNNNAFGQTGSAPSSPAPQNQPFSFGGTTSTSSSANAFSFGSSQPSSPALAPGPISQSNSFGGFGSSSQAPSPTTFAGPTSAPANGGGNLFTIGAAPLQNNARQVKKLPTRRGGKR